MGTGRECQAVDRMVQVGDKGIAALAMRCPGLRSLGLHCCRRLTDASQAALAVHLRNLTSLNISGCRALTPAAVQVSHMHGSKRISRQIGCICNGFDCRYPCINAVALPHFVRLYFRDCAHEGPVRPVWLLWHRRAESMLALVVQEVIDSNPGLHTCGGINRNVIVAGCLNLLSVSCSCPTVQPRW